MVEYELADAIGDERDSDEIGESPYGGIDGNTSLAFYRRLLGEVVCMPLLRSSTADIVAQTVQLMRYMVKEIKSIVLKEK